LVLLEGGGEVKREQFKGASQHPKTRTVLASGEKSRKEGSAIFDSRDRGIDAGKGGTKYSRGRLTKDEGTSGRPKNLIQRIHETSVP